MKYFLFGCALLLTSCARPNTPPPPKAEPIGLDSPIELRLHADDSGYTPSQVVRRRLFGLLPPKAAPLPEVAGVPYKCKGCTFNIAGGNQTNNTNNVGKKANGAAGNGAAANKLDKPKNSNTNTGSGDLTDQHGATNGAVAKGDNNGFHQTAEPPPPKLTGWQKFKAGLVSTWATVKWPLAIAAGLAGVATVVAWVAPSSAAGAWLLALVRRKKSTANQV